VTQAKKPTSRKETAELTRQKILETAMDIIGDQGYAALTTNKLVKQAGIAKGTLYHHFENIEAVMVCQLESFVDTCMESVPIDAHDSLLSYLYALGDFTLDMVDRDNKMLNTIVGLVPLSLRDEKFRLLNQRLFKSACAQLAPAYRRFMGEQVTDAQIDDIVRITDCFACGMSIHQAIFKDRELYTRLWRTICQLLVTELGGECF
jgi:AcrR family transcriptional regulator